MRSLEQIEREERRAGGLAEIFFKAFCAAAEQGRIHERFREMHRHYAGQSFALGREYLQRKYLCSV